VFIPSPAGCIETPFSLITQPLSSVGDEDAVGDSNMDPTLTPHPRKRTLTAHFDKIWKDKRPADKEKWITDNVAKFQPLLKKRKLEDMTHSKRKNAISNAFEAISQQVMYM
jgi:hypothetical protein